MIVSEIIMPVQLAVGHKAIKCRRQACGLAGRLVLLCNENIIKQIFVFIVRLGKRALLDLIIFFW